MQKITEFFAPVSTPPNTLEEKCPIEPSVIVDTPPTSLDQDDEPWRPAIGMVKLLLELDGAIGEVLLLKDGLPPIPSFAPMLAALDELQECATALFGEESDDDEPPQERPALVRENTILNPTIETGTHHMGQKDGIVRLSLTRNQAPSMFTEASSLRPHFVPMSKNQPRRQ